MALSSTASTNLAKTILAGAVAIVAWRAATLPLAASEATAWDRVVRPAVSALLTTPGDWSGILYGLLAKRAVGLFRLSEFSLRLPGILGCILYSYGMYRICRGRLSLLSIAAVPPILTNWFTTAGGSGLALGCSAVALAHPGVAGLWLGLAIASCPQIGVVPAMAAAALIYDLGFWKATERVVLPAIAIGFVLLIVPLSHPGPPLPKPSYPNERDLAIRSAMAVLNAEAGKGPARISATPSGATLLEFYRARDRRRDWTVGNQEPDYFLWVAPDPPPLAGPRQVLFHQSGVVLAR